MAANSCTMSQSFNCCTASAAASSSARICLVLDTVIMAVSIFVFSLLVLLRIYILGM